MNFHRCLCTLATFLAIAAGDCLAEINLVQTINDMQEGVDSVYAVFEQTPTEGNLLIAIAGNRDGSAAPTTPTGWSVAISSPTGDPGQIIYYKIAGTSESDTLSIGPYPFDSRCGLQLYEYSGIDSSDPYLLQVFQIETVYETNSVNLFSLMSIVSDRGAVQICIMINI